MLIVQQGLSVQQKLASIEGLLQAVASGRQDAPGAHSSVSSESGAVCMPLMC
jgi:hypothetical protein